MKSNKGDKNTGNMSDTGQTSRGSMPQAGQETHRGSDMGSANKFQGREGEGRDFEDAQMKSGQFGERNYGGSTGGNRDFPNSGTSGKMENPTEKPGHATAFDTDDDDDTEFENESESDTE